MTLRDYQAKSIDVLVRFIESKEERMVLCLPTGGGKTVIFSAFAKKMLELQRSVAIVVNRMELVKQTIDKLLEFGIIGTPITAGSKNDKTFVCGSVYVMMVETVHRRAEFLSFIREAVDVLIVDECHIGNFNKVIDGFKKVIGFTATPFYARRNKSLADIYKNLYVAAQTQHLIDKNHLVPAKTYAPADAPGRKKFKIGSNGEYDERSMEEILSSEHYINVCIKYVKQFGSGKRCIVYNASVGHSKRVTEAMRAAGLNAYHVDGTTPEEERKRILKALFEQSDAIVNNVGVLTFGFDCPDVEVIVLNRATTSTALYIQMCGRGSRLGNVVEKSFFTIVDLCANFSIHGLWQENRNWQNYFKRKRQRLRENKEMPLKRCPKCSYLNHTAVKVCGGCGFDFAEKENKAVRAKKAKPVKQTNIVISDNVISKLPSIIEHVNSRNQSPYRAIHLIKECVYNEYRKEKLNDLIQILLTILPYWCRAYNIKPNKFHRDFCIEAMTKYYDKIKSDEHGLHGKQKAYG